MPPRPARIPPQEVVSDIINDLSAATGVSAHDIRHGGKCREIVDARRQAMVELFQRGYSRNGIAKAWPCARTSVENLTTKVPRYKTEAEVRGGLVWTDTEKDLAAEMYLAGKPYAEIADRLRRTVEAVKRMVAEIDPAGDGEAVRCDFSDTRHVAAVLAEGGPFPSLKFKPDLRQIRVSEGRFRPVAVFA